MQTFKVNDKIEIICNWKNTRNGFKHTATLLLDGREYTTAKCCYLNRTWERYEYESVISEVLSKSKLVSDEEREAIKDMFADKAHKELHASFALIGAVAQLGDFFCKDKKENNDWKMRMIKAGLGEGLIMPEDWDNLDEDTKEERVNMIMREILADLK